MNIRNLVKQVLTEKENKRYRKLLEKRRMSYEQWVAEREKCASLQELRLTTQKEMIAESENKPIDKYSAVDVDRCVIFYMPGGRLAEGALESIARYFAANPQVQLVYGDEDVWESDKQFVLTAACQSETSGSETARRCPWFKPDWSPDLLDSYYYFGGMVAMRQSLLEKNPCPLNASVEVRKGGDAIVLLEQASVKAFVAWVHACVEYCGGRKPRCESIGHIPEILFHNESEENMQRYWKDMNRQVIPGKVASTGKVSIIIPSKDNPEVLENCIAGIWETMGSLTCEIIIVDNGSNEENKQRIEAFVRDYSGVKDSQGEVILPPIHYVYKPREFNFSGMCNLGAEKAKGDLLLFLNDDVELCEKGCITQMAELASRAYVGAVGMKLYYPDSTKIQHAGITNLPMGPVHKLQFLDDEESYYFGANRGLRNVLAVTAACLMVEKKKFQEVGGFSEELRVAFNDVDFCFSLYELGYQNVCCNNIYAYHHESLSRGADESTEKWQRLMVERDKLYERHPKLEGIDPYYGVGLGRDGLDTRIRPAYETAGNFLQFVKCNSEAVGKYSRPLDATGEAGIGGKSSAKRKSTPMEAISQEQLASYRQDNCLLVRVENCRAGVLQGYGVVLGDNNACYDKWLVLEPVVDSEVQPAQSSQNAAYMIKIDGQYRPDLVENMPDQKNVGLSGFWMETPQQDCGEPSKDKLPSGSYRIGMAARNRVTGLKLINFSTRMVEILS